jgi:hypothetical protein
MGQASHRNPHVISYLTMRIAVGCIGVVLPFVLAAGNWLIFNRGLQQSVSDYFYTGMRGVLVGGLCVIGAFLIAHRGDDRRDTLVTSAAGIGAIGVALFPAPPPRPSLGSDIAGYCHFGFGSLMFVSLVVIALWLLRKSGPGSRRLSQFRNRVHLTCGVVMVVALALAGIASLPVAATLGRLDPVFWMETAAIAAFGISWLVTCGAIMRDRRPVPARSLASA